MNHRRGLRAFVWLAPLAFAVTLVAAGRDAGLIDAVKASDDAAVRALLQKKVDVNAGEPDGTTALHWAASRDDLPLVKTLLTAGAKVNTPNRYGVTPLFVASSTGSAAVVDLLLAAGADPNTSLPEGETALMTAARSGKADVIRRLVARGAKINAVENWHGQTALMWAAAENHPAAIDALVEAGADMKVHSEGGFTALLFAAREGKIAALKALIRKGANVDDVLKPKVSPKPKPPEGTGIGLPKPIGTPEGTSALVLAVTNAHYELAKVLLEAGANPNAAEQGWTSLHQLQYTRRHVRTRGLPPPEQTGDLDSLGIVRVFAKHGANLNARQTHEITGDGQRNILNRVGATPFLLAAKHADVPMMKLLVELGADPKIPTEEGANALAVAAGVGIFAPGESVGNNQEAFEAVKYAYELGLTDLNVTDIHGWTPLHGSAVRGSTELTQFLIDKGARLDVKTKSDPSALPVPVLQQWLPVQIADGVVYANTFKRAEEVAALLRKTMKARGLFVPDVPAYKNASDVEAPK